MTADDVDLSHIPERYHARIHAMLNKHFAMWSGKLGEITTTEHVIELKPDSRPIAVPPYQAGPKRVSWNKPRSIDSYAMALSSPLSLNGLHPSSLPPRPIESYVSALITGD